MSLPALGRLVTLPAREVWANEPQVFTPWLAANLDLLSEALQLDELELRGTEYPAGDFRLDILAEDSEGNAVLIENQFGATDHGHLGQLISYVASENRKATVIWVAERFRDSHRAAIDWLNATTSEDYNFFAVEIEALRIGESAPAPFFNVVAKPNSWTKSVRAPSASGGAEEAERHIGRRAYWASFSSYLKSNDQTFAIRRERKDGWFDFPIGRAGFAISATLSSQKKRVGVELYIAKDPFKSGIRHLEAQKREIEAEFGEPLDWQELPTKSASRIASYWHGVDPFDPEQRETIHRWMLDRMQRFRRVFGPRVRDIDLAEVEADDTGTADA